MPYGRRNLSRVKAKTGDRAIDIKIYASISGLSAMQVQEIRLCKAFQEVRVKTLLPPKGAKISAETADTPLTRRIAHDQSYPGQCR
ncbi:MAG: hypothetical protein LBR80_03900 [Deltaproteobacteria bacterium]|jgi:hypothetical protein|nr:hypothetical protein [Deltaproteobacteria bacterium]